jgi:AbrB family looped-hinge helix DNA binding protein
MSLATMTSKGQITVPKDVRDRLRLQTGTRVDFRVNEANGTAVLVPMTKSVGQVFGILSKYAPKSPVSVEEMDAGIVRHLAEKHRART